MDDPSAPRTAEAAPLWTAADLAAVTGGRWLRPPGDGWRPERLTGCFGDRVRHPAGALVVVRTAERLAAMTGTPAAGLIVPAALAKAARKAVRSLPILRVESPVGAMHALARAARERMRGPLVAISGTVGKTTTRRMLTHILRQRGTVATNHGDLNYGGNVAEQLASMRPGTDFAVFELGLGAGRDSFLRIAGVLAPDIVMLTQAGPAHLDSLTDAPLDAAAALRLVAEQKLQLARALRPEGAVLLNDAIPIAGALAAEMRRQGRRVLAYGREAGADARLIAAARDGDGATVEAAILGRRLAWRLRIPGMPAVENSLGAVLAAAALGIDPAAAADALGGFEAAEGRAGMIDLAFGDRRIRLIDDSFNATPLSVRATLALLAETATRRGGRRIAILGDIAHLGPASASIHAGFAGDVAAAGIDLVYTMGDEMAHLRDALPPARRGGHFARHGALVAALLAAVEDGDVVTVKASMPLRFGTIVRMLRDRSEPAAAETHLHHEMEAANLPVIGESSARVGGMIGMSEPFSGMSAVSPAATGDDRRVRDVTPAPAPAAASLEAPRTLPPAPPMSSWRPPLPWADDLQATCLAAALHRRGIAFERTMRVRRRGTPPKPWVGFSIAERSYFYRQGILLCGPKGCRLADARHVNGANPTITSDKLLTKRLLAAIACPVPTGEAFAAGRGDAARRYFGGMTGPACVKPQGGTQGRGLATAIRTVEDFDAAFELAAALGVVIVEEDVPGQAVRFLYLEPDIVAVRLDTPAHVVGDGGSSIATLIEEKNRERAARGLPSYPPIEIDATIIRHLGRQALTILDVPAAGRRVMLRGSSNVPSGGEAVAGEHLVHPSYGASVARICRTLPGLRFAAVDTIIEDVAAPAEAGRHWILELNSAPGLLSFQFLWEGRSPDVAGALVDKLIEASW